MSSKSSNRRSIEATCTTTARIMSSLSFSAFIIGIILPYYKIRSSLLEVSFFETPSYLRITIDNRSILGVVIFLFVVASFVTCVINKRFESVILSSFSVFLYIFDLYLKKDVFDYVSSVDNFLYKLIDFDFIGIGQNIMLFSVLGLLAASIVSFCGSKKSARADTTLDDENEDVACQKKTHPYTPSDGNYIKSTNPVNSESQTISALREYKKLLDEGIISEEEFNKKKQELLK